MFFSIFIFEDNRGDLNFSTSPSAGFFRLWIQFLISSNRLGVLVLRLYNFLFFASFYKLAIMVNDATRISTIFNNTMVKPYYLIAPTFYGIKIMANEK